jgi:hypothetical protein
MNIYSYYIYAYLRNDGTPYYIGKGSGYRAWSKHIGLSLPKNKSKIIIMEKNLTELGALALERFYIRWYGRKNNGTGILRNKTEGGEGGDTLSHHPNKENIIKKIIESNKNNPKHKKYEKLNPNWGNRYIHTEETRKLISEKITGRKLSNQQRTKLSEIKKKPTIINGIKFNSRTEAAKYFNVSSSTITTWLNKK